ncbi:hypothetical protein CJU90_5397 [Yarrowia sp. C11]|nr:hypothetical protein CJU90_5397 [Yarrowia sp. C11]KAG5363994.1 hypothetical protein CKK34_2776 [Yarrowia sp. E02]
MNEGNTAFLYKAKASKKDKAAAKRERHHTKLSKRGGISKADLKRKKPVYDRPFDYGNPEKNEAAMRPVSATVNKGTPLAPADIDAIMADGATAKEIKRQQRQEARRQRVRETETLAANLDDLLDPLKSENGGRTREKLDHTPNPRNARGNEAIIKAETKRFNKILNSKEYQASPFASLQAFLKTQIPQNESQQKDKKMHM